MTRTTTDDSCRHICCECDCKFDCGCKPEDCRETRFIPCEDCRRLESNRRDEDTEYLRMQA